LIRAFRVNSRPIGFLSAIICENLRLMFFWSVKISAIPIIPGEISGFPDSGDVGDPGDRRAQRAHQW